MSSRPIHYYRPHSPEVAAKYADQVPDISLFTVVEVFSGWRNAHAIHFTDDGVFDQISKPAR